MDGSEKPNNAEGLLAEIKKLHIAKSILTPPRGGIIDASGVALINDMTRQERSLKKEYVLQRHVTPEGTPRQIKPPTGTINGWSTRVEGKKRIKAKTYDLLIDKLFEIYSDGCLNMSFQNVFEMALQQKAELCSENTETKYKADYKRFITEDFGKMIICDMTADEIKKYATNLVKSMELKKEAFRAFKSVLNLTFEFALSKGYVNTNPVTRMQNQDFYRICQKQFKSAEQKAMSPQQIEAITKEVRRRMDNPVKYGPCYTCGFMFIFASYTGMRAGEISALKWTDITDERIHIHAQQLKKGNTMEFEYVPWTKNERRIPKGGRYFPMTEKIRALLKELREAQERAGINSEWVFANPDGSWVLADTCYEKFLYRICKSLGYSITNNHAIRMYFNSYVLIPKGIDVTNRAKLLGHSVEVNLKNYSFADYDYCEIAQRALDDEEGTPWGPPNVFSFETKKLRKSL